MQVTTGAPEVAGRVPDHELAEAVSRLQNGWTFSPSVHHGGRWLFVDPSGAGDGWSYSPARRQEIEAALAAMEKQDG